VVLTKGSTSLLWESKSGLYPNGKRNSFGGHAVLLISGDVTNVPAVEWENFLKHQEQLRSAVQANREKATDASLPDAYRAEPVVLRKG